MKTWTSFGSLVCKAVEMMFCRGPAGFKSRREWRSAPACCGSGERYGSSAQTLLPLLIEMLCPNALFCLHFCGCFYALQPNVSNFLVFCHILSLLVCIWLLFELGILVTGPLAFPCFENPFHVAFTMGWFYKIICMSVRTHIFILIPLQGHAERFQAFKSK